MRQHVVGPAFRGRLNSQTISDGRLTSRGTGGGIDHVERLQHERRKGRRRRFHRGFRLRCRQRQGAGIHQRAEAQVAGRTCLTLDLQMYLGAPEPHDAIQIAGEPPVDVLIRGGVAGDQATVAVLVNTARRLATVPPGLKLVTDLPVPRWA